MAQLRVEELFYRVSNFVYAYMEKGVSFIISVVIAFAVLFLGSKLINFLLKKVRVSLEKKQIEPGVVSFLISAGKIALYAVLIVIAAQILGFAASSVIAVLGSAGLAIGLALQGSLANFAGGVLLLLMKPFIVGDYIIVDSVEGTVKKIDIVYTTLHTADNRAVILPNGKLADSNIINATREDKRRIDIDVAVEYSENIGRVRDVLQKIVDHQDKKLEDMPVNIVVSSLDESAVTMAVHMWVHPDDYWTVRWGMLEEIKDEFDKNGIVIPFNQLDVNINTTGAKENGK